MVSATPGNILMDQLGPILLVRFDFNHSMDN